MKRLDPFKGTEFPDDDPLYAVGAEVDAEDRLPVEEFGDVEGHPFHGNQYTDGEGAQRDALTRNLGGAVAALRENGGFTITPDGARVKEGFAVAIGTESTVVPAEKFFTDRAAAKEAIKSFLRSNAEVFSQPGMHIGGWHDTERGMVVFDPVQVFPKDHEAEAVLAGRQRDQIAIYSLARRQGNQLPGGSGGYAERAQE
jgi:hypothetical protein